ncbi:apolipoprotein N-acyltransferase [Wohlfahrtiimonas larvae]|uniref:Apolipoprotein N-acyltransferase n=1 Tax=Wohlfahrtiimonas larvae TaxID=1157986 RepID=A0ABP9MKA3_9GAMM|nr:apolipoprotein N-acyltransferase [Wohlfahrtiimonas larvae]
MKRSNNLLIQIIIVITLGALMPLAFAPFNQWWLAPLLLMAWQLTIKNNSKIHSFWLSYLFGLSIFAVGLWWVRISVNQFGGAPLPLAITIVFVLSGYLAIYYGVLGYLTQKINVGTITRYLLLLPTAGVLLEILRSHAFTGFPWLAMGYSLTPTLLAQYLFPVFGALISSFIVYWLAGVLLLIITTFNQRSFSRSFISIIASTIIIVGSTLGLQKYLSDPIQNLSEPINIALIQGNITQDQKFDETQFEASLKTYLSLTENVINKANLVVWPETAVVAYYNNMSSFLENLRQWSDYTDTELLLGIPRNQQLQDFNAFLHLGESSSQDQFYDKYRLLPFGEYIPIPDVFGIFYEWINIPLAGFTKGAPQQAPFTFSQFSTQTTGSICFEAVFGESLRYQANQSGFLVNISNDAWFGDSLAPWQHLQIVQARAIEFARPIARATNTGLTAFVASNGEIIAQAPQFEATTLSTTIIGKKGLTTYVKYGDNPWIIVASTLFLLIIICSFKNRRKQYTRKG